MGKVFLFDFSEDSWYIYIETRTMIDLEKK